MSAQRSGAPGWPDDLLARPCALDALAWHRHRASAPEPAAAYHQAWLRHLEDPGNAQLGFIAEDVPGIVATQDRQGLSPMEMVALLTKVVQAQDAEIDRLNTDLVRRLEELEKHLPN